MAFLIFFSTTALLTGAQGLGIACSQKTRSAIFSVGWVALLSVASIAWFLKLPTNNITLLFWATLILGIYHFFKNTSRYEILLTILSGASLSFLFAIPFITHDGLLAYSQPGTDMWGYTGVSQWLMSHSIDQIPEIDCKPGHDWIWYVLTIKDRPLIYVVLATLASAFHFSTVVAYYALVTALFSSLLIILYSDFIVKFSKKAWISFLLSLLICIQPRLLLHFDYQFYSGTVVALLFSMGMLAILRIESTGDKSHSLLLAFLGILFLLMCGLYSLSLTWVGFVVLAIAGQIQKVFKRYRAGFFVYLFVLAGLTRLCMTYIKPEAPPSPAHGVVGNLWVHYASIFGITDIVPWYAPGDSYRHFPASGWFVSILLVLFVYILVFTCWRWWKEKKTITLPFIICTLCGCLALVSPPRGEHWAISRGLPIFAVPLFWMSLSALSLHIHRILKITLIALCAFPILHAGKSLGMMHLSPDNLFVVPKNKTPSNTNTWECLAYVYYFEETEKIDWKKAPDCFLKMTHYMPEHLKPKMDCEAK